MYRQLKAGAIGGIHYRDSGEIVSYMPGVEDTFVTQFAEAMYINGAMAVGYVLPDGGGTLLTYRLLQAVMNEYGVGDGDDDFVPEAEYISQCAEKTMK